MRIKSIILLIALLTSSYAQAKESDGHKFWHGTGGQLVAVGVIWWALSGDDETEQSSFQVYSDNDPMSSFISFNYTEANQMVDDKILRFNFSQNKKFNPYLFRETSDLKLLKTQDLLFIGKSEAVGIGLNMKLNNPGTLEFSYSSTRFMDDDQSEEFSLKFNYRF